MFRSRWSWAAARTAAAGTIAASGAWVVEKRSRRLTACEAAKPRDHKGPGFVGVFLDKESAAKVRKVTAPSTGALKHTDVPHAIIHLQPDPETFELYAPLFGAKAKLQVTGVAQEEATKQSVLIVDVRIGGGSVASDVYVPSIACASESWEDDVADLLGADLARRLKSAGVVTSEAAKGAKPNSQWHGDLPATSLDGVRYPATRATYSRLDSPVALQGTLCASNSYDVKAGECVARRRPASEDDEIDDEDGEDEEAVGECPLCTYMMNSPCKDVFVVFKECLDHAAETEESEDLTKCAPSAAVVNECIIKHGLFKEFQDDDDEEDED